MSEMKDLLRDVIAAGMDAAERKIPSAFSDPARGALLSVVLTGIEAALMAMLERQARLELDGSSRRPAVTP